MTVRLSPRVTTIAGPLCMAAGLLLLPCAVSGQVAADGCRPSAETNRRVVQDFYALGLAGLQPRAAFLQFMAPDFVEHKADVPEGTREATITYLEALIHEVPSPRWELLRTIAEGDLVVLHARFTPAEGAPAYAIADIFRLEHCAIVEHWDVVAPPPREQLNPHGRF